MKAWIMLCGLWCWAAGLLWGQMLPSIEVGYWMEDRRPGWRIGAEYSILQQTYRMEKVKRRRVVVRSAKHELLSNLGVSMVSLMNQHRVLVNAQLGYRLTAKGGFFMELMGGVALYNIVNAGVTYMTDEDGNVVKVLAAGRSYPYPNGGWGVGYDLSHRKIAPVAFYVRVGGGAVFEYALLGGLSHFNATIGAAYRLNFHSKKK